MCARYDQASFDPGFQSYPLEHFIPYVEEVFSRSAYWWTDKHPKKQVLGIPNPCGTTMSHAIRRPIIKPKYSGGGDELPDKFVIDCKNITNMSSTARILPTDLEANDDILTQARDLFVKQGIVYLKNTGLSKVEDLEKWGLTISGGAGKLKKKLTNKIFGYSARCDISNFSSTKILILY